MTTITVFGVTFELVSEDAIRVFRAQEALEQYKKDAFVDYKKAKYPHEIDKLMEEVSYRHIAPHKPIDDFADIIKAMYWELVDVEDDAYRQYAEKDFLEYASHMNEPDFDWSFYSDWHKDIYGYRPHY